MTHKCIQCDEECEYLDNDVYISCCRCSGSLRMDNKACDECWENEVAANV